MNENESFFRIYMNKVQVMQLSMYLYAINCFALNDKMQLQIINSEYIIYLTLQ